MMPAKVSLENSEDSSWEQRSACSIHDWNLSCQIKGPGKTAPEGGKERHLYHEFPHPGC